MSRIVDVLKMKIDLLCGSGVPEESIISAEKQLGVSFAADYREYLKDCGVAAYDGHELTGITRIDRVNVVNITLEEKEKNGCVSKEMYVVEQTHYNGIVIWQDSTGTIYQTTRDSEPLKIYDSLTDYIDK